MNSDWTSYRHSMVRSLDRLERVDAYTGIGVRLNPKVSSREATDETEVDWIHDT
jgi:hypothetical protein